MSPTARSVYSRAERGGDMAIQPANTSRTRVWPIMRRLDPWRHHPTIQRRRRAPALIFESHPTGCIMNTDLECINILSQAVSKVCEWLNSSGYVVADDGVLIARDWEHWCLTIHTTAVDGDSVIFAWSADDIADQLDRGVFDAI